MVSVYPYGAALCATDPRSRLRYSVMLTDTASRVAPPLLPQHAPA
jgi:hypothetical protein